jgi:hypothetical protein
MTSRQGENRLTCQTTTRCFAFKAWVLNVVEKNGLLLYGRTIQVMSKEMNEMRMNHRRGVVTNLVVAQNRRDPRPERISHKRYL